MLGLWMRRLLGLVAAATLVPLVPRAPLARLLTGGELDPPPRLIDEPCREESR